LAREILGGDGILQQHHVMRHLVDIEAIYTFEGTWDINTLIVGRELTGLSAFM
jgi:glutaryl-CoA dehydrogenase